MIELLLSLMARWPRKPISLLLYVLAPRREDRLLLINGGTGRRSNTVGTAP